MNLASSGARLLVIAVLIVLFFPVLAYAQSLRPAPSKTVFGCEFGKPLELPECQTDANTERFSRQLRVPLSVKIYAPIQPVTCVEKYESRYNKAANYQRPRINIVFGERKSPRIFNPKYVYVNTIDENGVLIGVDFYTGGTSTQQLDLLELVEKYGEPTTQRVGTVQNKLGGKFDDIFAAWKFSDLEVTLYGTFGTMDKGWVTIDTPEAARLRKEWTEATRAGEPKL